MNTDQNPNNADITLANNVYKWRPRKSRTKKKELPASNPTNDTIRHQSPSDESNDQYIPISSNNDTVHPKSPSKESNDRQCIPEDDDNSLNIQDCDHLILYEYRGKMAGFRYDYKESLPLMHITDNLLHIGSDKFKFMVVGFFDSNYVWQWPWNQITDDDHVLIRDVYTKLPTKLQTSDTAQLESNLSIELLLAYIYHLSGLTYIYPMPFLNGTMIALGMKQE